MGRKRMFSNVYEGKRVLVTGHTGFKGAWLSLWLEKLGAEVHGYSIDIPTTPALSEITQKLDRAEFNSRDVLEFETFRDYFTEVKPHFVFHLAAQAIVRTCYDNPRDAFLTNSLGTINLLEILRNWDHDCTAVFITSDKCYENVEWEFGYRETDQLGGQDPYSASKAAAEIAFSCYFRSYLNNKHNIRVASARAGNVIGGGDWAKDRIVPDTIRAWANNQSVELRSPNATRPWQLVLEPLSGYLRLGAELSKDAPNTNGSSFNFGPTADTNFPVRDLVEEMSRIWKNTSFTIAKEATHKKECSLLRLCCDRAEHYLNWSAVLNFKETTRMVAEWYIQYHQAAPAEMKSFSLSQLEAYETLARERGHAWARN